MRVPSAVFKAAALRAYFDVGGNLVLRTFFVQLPFFVGTVVATGISDTTLAAHGVLMQLFFIMTFSLDGFAHTAESLAGYTYGAKLAQKLKQSAYYCALWAVVLAGATAFTYLALGGQFIALLTTSPEVIGVADQYLPWLVVAPFFCVGAFLFDGIFIGTTHIRQMRNSMVIAAIVWALTLWLTYSSLNYHAVWLAMCVFMLIRTVLLALHFPAIVQHASESPNSTSAHK